MKHVLFFLLISFFFTATLFGQKFCPGCSTPKDQWVYLVIQDENTQGFWLSEGINPDPKVSLNWGDTVPFFFEDHYHWTAPADSDGESPWSLIGDWYDVNVAPVTIATAKTDTIATLTPVQNSMWSSENLPSTIKWLLLFLVLLAILFAISNRKWLFNTDNNPIVTTLLAKEKEPVVEPIILTDNNVNEVGPPVYVNGLTDNTVLNHFENQMEREGKILPIVGIKSGLLYSIEPVNVAFNDRDRLSLLRGVPGYQVELDLGEGKTTKRYTLKPCGNDVTRPEEEGIQHIIFVPDEIQSSVLSPVIETIVEEAATTHPETGEVTEFMNVIQKTLENKKSGHVRFSSSIDGTMIDVDFEEREVPAIFLLKSTKQNSEDTFGK